MMLGILTRDIRFSYRPAGAYDGMIQVVIPKGEGVELSNARITLDRIFYDATPMNNQYGVLMSVFEEDVEIINTEWKKLK